MTCRLRLITVAAVLLAFLAADTAMATPRYPDLKTLPPRDLRFDRADISADGSGNLHNVLRLSNTVWNAGEGPLEIRAKIDPATNSGPAMQRVLDTNGTYTDIPMGSTLYYHAVHAHYHFDNWGKYQLWTKAAYDAWVASGRTSGAPEEVGTKTTSCVMDEEFTKSLVVTPWPGVYPSGGCGLSGSSMTLAEGLSPGWGDTYDWYRFEQWVDLGQGTLADGSYVLRSIADPLNLVYESANKADTSRESQVDNEGVTAFTVSGGKLVDSNLPSGTVSVNHVDTSTSSPNVKVQLVGRDDVSGVDKVRLSNDGQTWATYTFTGSGSTPMEVDWNLTNPAYGGTSAGGSKTVYAQFHDVSGKWGASETDGITLNAGSPPPTGPYATAVLADAPVSWWRLGEASGNVAADSVGSNPGSYQNGATLGKPGLLTGDPSTSVGFDGVNDFTRVPNAATLNFSGPFSVEAWIKPNALPAAGSFASIATKAESYSLQFNGPRLEWNLIDSSGTRQRTQAAAGAVVAGKTYHAVGTWDGTTARLYLNGAQVASTTPPKSPASSTSPLSLGSWDGTAEYLNGTIDEVAAYKSALSAARVSAHYAAGSATSAPTLVAPTNLTATSPAYNRVDLSWTDNSTGETSQLLQRSTSSTFATTVDTIIGAGAAQYTDNSVAPGTAYWYRIRSVAGGSSSAWSASASATTAAAPPPATYASTVLGDSPASYWRLGEAPGLLNAADQTVANPGTYLNGVAQGTPSLLLADPNNTSATFDGTNDLVRVGTSGTLNLTSPMTLEAWIKPTALPAAGQFASVVTKPESYSLQFNGPKIEFTVMQMTVRRRLQAPAGAISPGQLYHVVGTYDGSNQRLYINGALVATAPLTGAATTTTNSLYIGSWDGTAEFFKGAIDEVAVYPKVLSGAAVTAHYVAGHG